jgi:hypothetical protein
MNIVQFLGALLYSLQRNLSNGDKLLLTDILTIHFVG